MTRSQTQSFGNSQTPSHAVGNAVPFCNAVAVPEHVGARGGLFHRVHIPVAHSFAERDPQCQRVGPVPRCLSDRHEVAGALLHPPYPL